MSSLSFQPNLDAMDNFDAVDLSWVRCTTDPLEVLRHGSTFLQDPSKINGSNHEVWCNLHITPALEGIIVEVHSLEEVGLLGQETVPGVCSRPHGAQSHQLDCCIGQ